MARFSGGWVKLHRSLAEKDIAQNLFLFGVWTYLILIANYKESQILWNGTQRILKPGQCLIKMRELSEKWECSTRTIHKWFHYLHDTGRIVLEGETHGTVITICNWSEYQLLDEEEETPSKHEVNTKETPSKHEVNYSEEGKNRRRKERKKSNVGIRMDYPPLFESAWEAYGRHGDKKAAYEVWAQLKLTEPEIADLTKAISQYTASTSDIRYRKHFARFLKADWREWKNHSLNGHDSSNWKWIFGTQTEPEQDKDDAGTDV